MSEDRLSPVTGSVILKCRFFCQTYGVFQDRWSLVPVVSQDRFHCNTYMGHIDLAGFKVIMGSFAAFCFKMACKSKTADRRANWAEIWESGTLVTHMGYI